MVAEFSGAVVMGMSDALTAAMCEIDALFEVLGEHQITTPDGGQIVGMFNFTRLVRLVGVTEAKRVPKVRLIYQVLGTDIVRRHNDAAWVQVARNTILEHFAQGRPVAITGIRYPNELAMVRALGGAAIWVERPGHPSSGNSDHSSETSLTAKDFDATILNSGTLADLRAKAHHVAGDAGLTGLAGGTDLAQKCQVSATTPHLRTAALANG